MVAAGLLPVGSGTVFHSVQGLQILVIVRIHGNRPTDMLQSHDPIAQTVVRQGAQIVPPGIPLLGILQRIQCFPIPAEADVVQGCLLVVVPGIGIGVAALLIAAESAEGIVLAVAAIAAALGLLVFLL